MLIPIEELDQRQRLWFAKLCINVVLLSDEISISEMNFVQSVINLITDPVAVKALLKSWEAEEAFALEEPPKSLNQNQRALIYMEIIHLVIQDKQLNEKESKYLANLANIFSFSPNYYKELMHHCLEGLAWLQGQNEILNRHIDAINPVDLYGLNQSPREWYARLLVIAILMVNNPSSSVLDKTNLAIDSLESAQMKKLLKAHLQKSIMPGPKPPPAMREEQLILILMDILQVLGSRGGVTEKGDRFFSQLLLVCKQEGPRYSAFIDWCNLGLSWRKGQIQLAAKAKIDHPEETQHNPEGVEQHPENTSLIVRNFGCFVCHSSAKFASFTLIPNSQKTVNNIFGIPTYHGSKEGYDACDYNKIKLITCPMCFFTSASKDYFKKFPDDRAPKEITGKFKDQWMKSIPQFREVMGGKFNPMDLNRSKEQVYEHYKLAFKSAEMMGMKPDSRAANDGLTLLLTQAQILTSYGAMEEAARVLKRINDSILSRVGEFEKPSLLFRWYRLGILFHLYFGNLEAAKNLYKAFANLSQTRQWEAQIRREFDAQIIYCQKALRNATRFERRNMARFHLKKAKA